MRMSAEHLAESRRMLHSASIQEKTAWVDSILRLSDILNTPDEVFVERARLRRERFAALKNTKRRKTS